MAAAKVTTSKEGDVLRAHVSGYVGENSGLFDLNVQGSKKVVIDLSGVNYINSVGVKNWITWTGRMPKNIPIEFENCPALIVNQVNMVAGFIPKTGSVESLFAPFICEDCSVEENHLLRRGADYDYAQGNAPYSLNLPEHLCPKCGKPMELDALEMKFFAFLKTPPEQPQANS